jgi:hypothetical protein
VRKSRRLRSLLCCVLVVAALFIGLVIFVRTNSEPQLTDRSKPVANVTGDWWKVIHTCFWISPHELLTFRMDKSRSMPYAFSSPVLSRTRMKTENTRGWLPYPAEPQLQCVVIDTTSGNERVLNKLTSTLDIPFREDLAPTLSPDGKQLLVCQTAGGLPSYIACGLDGANLITWDIGQTCGPLFTEWMPDSRHWLEISQKDWKRPPTVTRYSLNNLSEATVLTSTKSQAGSAGTDRLGRPLLFEVVRSNGVGSNHCDYVLHTLKTSAASGEVSDIRLPVSPSATMDRLPRSDLRDLYWRHNELVQLRLSHSRGSVAYLVYSSGGGALASWPAPLRKLLGSDRREDPLKCALWVCGLDGKNAREVGSVEVRRESNRPTAVQWLPDDKHISFVLGNRLWITPAD